MVRFDDDTMLQGRGQTAPEEQQEVGMSCVMFSVFLTAQVRVECALQAFGQKAPERINICVPYPSLAELDGN